MTEIAKYLTGVKVKMGVKSDLQLALRLGISQGMVNKIMMGVATPGDEVCIKIAELAGENPERVILLAHKSKASEKTRTYWEHIFNLLPEPKKTAVAASLALLIAVPVLADFSLHNATQYILCDIVLSVLFLLILFKNTIIPNKYKEVL